MKRKILSMLLALVLLLLCSCSSTDADPTGGTVTTGTDVYHQKVMERLTQYEFKPPYEGEPWIEYDPDRKVYISLGGQDDCDFYPDTGLAVNYIPFWVISTEKYDLSQILVEISAQTEYEVRVADLSRDCHNTVYNQNFKGAMTEQQYMSMIGVDFQERERLEAYAGIAIALRDEFSEKVQKEYPKVTVEVMEEIKASEEYQAYNALASETRGKLKEVTKQYQALTEKDLPQFYAYWVSVCFTGLGSHEETVETLTVTLGQDIYEVNVGQWRLHTQTPQEILDAWDTDGFLYAGGGLHAAPFPISDGMWQVTFSGEVENDTTVTGVRQLQTQVAPVKVLCGNVQIYEKVEGKEELVLVLEYLWDTRTPLEFERGQFVQIDLCVQDDRLKDYHVGFTSYLFLDYTVRGVKYTTISEARYAIHDDPWNIYLMAFSNVDVGEAHYYNEPKIGWFQDIPAQWLNQ